LILATALPVRCSEGVGGSHRIDPYHALIQSGHIACQPTRSAIALLRNWSAVRMNKQSFQALLRGQGDQCILPFPRTVVADARGTPRGPWTEAV
jgi:hypothetical protein